MEITKDLIYLTMGLVGVVSVIIAYVLHKKNIHLSFL